LNPNFDDTFRDTHERLVGAAQSTRSFVEFFASTAREIGRDKITLEIGKFRELESPAVMLWELIKDLGFKFDQCKKAINVSQPGKIFLSATHQLVVDRDRYIIEKKRSTDFVTITIEEGQPLGGEPPHTLALREVSKDNFKLQHDSTVAQLDADQLRFPLLWRRWRAGDYFVPLGMNQEKKLSDFLIDLKIPFNSKADITVLESAGTIVWVVGLRISERYKVNPDTKRILVIEQTPPDG
jgi:tRNA(Ile)-lysidine synthase